MAVKKAVKKVATAAVAKKATKAVAKKAAKTATKAAVAGATEKAVSAVKKPAGKTSTAQVDKLKAENAALKARVKELEKVLKDTVKNINKAL